MDILAKILISDCYKSSLERRHYIHKYSDGLIQIKRGHSLLKLKLMKPVSQVMKRIKVTDKKMYLISLDNSKIGIGKFGVAEQ